MVYNSYSTDAIEIKGIDYYTLHPQCLIFQPQENRACMHT